LLQLTPDAAQRLQQVRAARQQRFRSLLSPWERADVEQLGDLLARFNQLVGDTLDEDQRRGNL
jgi:DNA-binding MarR family transcriptional regulator